MTCETFFQVAGGPFACGVGGGGGDVCGISRRSLVLAQHGGVSGAPGLSVAPSGGACAFAAPLA